MANRAFAQRTARKFLVSITIVFRCRGRGSIETRRYHTKKLAAVRQLLFAVSIAKESIVANAMEATGQNMEQKSADEFLRQEGHGFLLIVVTIVTPAEFYVAIFDIHEPMIGDGHTVGVTTDVIHDLLGTAERRFGVNNPFRSPRLSEITGKGLRISKCFQRSEELQLAGIEGFLQVLQEQPTEQTG